MTFMEVSEVLGNLGEFVGAIVVVLTLLYLAVQVRDSGRAALFAAVQANRTQRVSFHVDLRDSPYIAAILTKEESDQPLDQEEQGRLYLHWAAQWGLIYAEWVQRELGSAGEYAVKDDTIMALMSASKSARAWLAQAGDGIYPEKFIAYANSRMQDLE